MKREKIGRGRIAVGYLLPPALILTFLPHFLKPATQARSGKHWLQSALLQSWTKQMAHRDHPSHHFHDAKMARFAFRASSSLLSGGRELIVPFYSVQDCRLVFQPFCKISNRTPKRSRRAQENYFPYLSVLIILISCSFSRMKRGVGRKQEINGERKKGEPVRITQQVCHTFLSWRLYDWMTDLQSSL